MSNVTTLAERTITAFTTITIELPKLMKLQRSSSFVGRISPPSPTPGGSRKPPLSSPGHSRLPAPS